jgi:hypothetical protein
VRIVNRWRVALGTLWRIEPAPALGLYFLMSAAEVGYIHFVGLRFEHLGSDSAMVAVKYGSWGVLLPYAFFTWRMWLGGNISWTLSLLWKLFSVAAAAAACLQAPGLLTAGPLALSLASTAALFARAVLDRVDWRRQSAATPRARLRLRQPGIAGSRPGGG